MVATAVSYISPNVSKQFVLYKYTFVMSNYNIAVIINQIAGGREGGIFSRFSTLMICSNDNYNNNNVNFIYFLVKFAD